MDKLHFFRKIGDSLQAEAMDAYLLSLMNESARLLGLPEAKPESWINFASVNGEIVSYEFAHKGTFEESWEAACEWLGGESNAEYLGYGTWHHAERMNLEAIAQ